MLKLNDRAKEIYTELENKLNKVAKDSWDELNPLILGFSARLAELQAEKTLNKKISTDLDIEYLLNVSLPSIERIVRGRNEDAINEIWDYVKEVLNSVVKQSVKLAVIAVKAYVGGAV